MDHNIIFSELARNKETFKGLLNGIEEPFYRWRTQPEKWNLLDIVCHLYDEEREDFRARVKSVLENPDKPLTPINPVAWVNERQYSEQNYQTKLADFLSEREKSVKWLKSLTSPQWDNQYEHPSLGPMSAQLFLANWLAHDYLHIRQIIRLKFAYLQQRSNEDLSYAGNW